MIHKPIPCHVTYDGAPVCRFPHIVAELGACSYPALYLAEDAIKDDDVALWRQGLKVVRGRCPDREKERVG